MGTVDFPTYINSDGSLVTAQEGGVMFGVRSANGLAQPWVAGFEPNSYIWDNPYLGENVSWSGTLVGMTPNNEAVTGSAGLRFDLTTFDGDLNFTDMVSWPAHQNPLYATGGMWGDGDLRYSVQIYHNGMDSVFGNLDPGYFDDEGIVDGGFFGKQHQGMGGTLQRDDLTAAFGGNR